MPNPYNKNFITKAKENYFKIGSIICPALNNKLVNFTELGFHHLLYKQNKERSKMEQRRRLNLIPYAIQVIKCSSKIKSITHISTITYYALEENVNNKYVKVIITCKDNKDLLFFFSVMNR